MWKRAVSLNSLYSFFYFQLLTAGLHIVSVSSIPPRLYSRSSCLTFRSYSCSVCSSFLLTLEKERRAPVSRGGDITARCSNSFTGLSAGPCHVKTTLEKTKNKKNIVKLLKHNCFFIVLYSLNTGDIPSQAK